MTLRTRAVAAIAIKIFRSPAALIFANTAWAARISELISSRGKPMRTPPNNSAFKMIGFEMCNIFSLTHVTSCLDFTILLKASSFSRIPKDLSVFVPS